MPITFKPSIGMVLMCNFDTGFRPPEMVKIRPVVVLSHQRHNSQTCVVVPLSTTAPATATGVHHKIDPLSLPARLRKRSAAWAKCDMVTTVGLERLDRVKDGRDAAGKRRYVAQSVTLDDLLAIRRAVLVSLGLGALCPHLTRPAAPP
jgi:uncharacterized protein YifN (PemK superfamily)